MDFGLKSPVFFAKTQSALNYPTMSFALFFWMMYLRSIPLYERRTQFARK